MIDSIDKIKPTVEIEFIEETAFLVARVYRKNAKNGFWFKKTLDKILKLFEKQNIKKLIYPNDDYILRKITNYNFYHFDNSNALKILAADIFYAVLKNNHYTPMVYARQNYSQITPLLYRLCMSHKNVRLCIGLEFDSEILRRHLIDEYGLSVIISRNKIIDDILLLCFDVPDEKFLNLINPRQIINLSQDVINYEYKVYSQFEIISDEIKLPKGTNNSLLLMYLIDSNPKLVKKCKLYKILS